MVFEFDVEGQNKKGMLRRKWKKQVEEKRIKIELSVEDNLF